MSVEELGFSTTQKARQVNFRVDEATWQITDEIAKGDGISRAELARQGLEMAITAKAMGSSSANARASVAVDQIAKYYNTEHSVTTSTNNVLHHLQEARQTRHVPGIVQAKLFLEQLRDTGYLDPEMLKVVDTALHT